MVELVDTRDLKSLDLYRLFGFKSRLWYKFNLLMMILVKLIKIKIYVLLYDWTDNIYQYNIKGMQGSKNQPENLNIMMVI